MAKDRRVSVGSGRARDHVLQRHAIQVLHDDERLVIFLSDFIDCADVGMIQRGSGLRFALKPSHRLGILGEFFGQELQCDEAVKRGVLCFVNHTHPATAEHLNHEIMRNGLADHGEGLATMVGPKLR